MGVDVKTFLGSLPARGKLDAWEAQIFELLAANATYAQVVEFLKQNGVEARRGEISNFVHRKKRRSRLEAIRQGAADVPSSQPQTTPPTTPAQSPASTTQDQQPAAPTGTTQQATSTAGQASPSGALPKFNFQAHRNKKPNW
jgi:hypothetical protein